MLWRFIEYLNYNRKYLRQRLPRNGDGGTNHFSKKTYKSIEAGCYRQVVPGISRVRTPLCFSLSWHWAVWLFQVCLSIFCLSLFIHLVNINVYINIYIYIYMISRRSIFAKKLCFFHMTFCLNLQNNLVSR